MVFRLGQDGDTIFPSALAVGLGVLDADLNVLRVVGRDLAFSDSEAAISGFHLDAVIRDPQADGKAKRL
jgi:hypothetical protein